MTEFCGAKTKAGKPCTRPAGWGTGHVGTGKCKLHGGASNGRPILHGLNSRYAVINRPRIKELLEAFDTDDAPLDLLPEVKLLRALILDYVERYDEYTEALLSWHASYNPAFDGALELWQQSRDVWLAKYLEWVQAFAEYRKQVEKVQNFYKQGWPEPPDVPLFPDPPKPPQPHEFAGKPQKVLDILNAGKFIVQIGSLVERIEKQKSEGSISLAQVRELLNQHGFEMYQGVKEKVSDETLCSAILENVEGRWAEIELPEPSKRI